MHQVVGGWIQNTVEVYGIDVRGLFTTTPTVEQEVEQVYYNRTYKVHGNCHCRAQSAAQAHKCIRLLAGRFKIQ